MHRIIFMLIVMLLASGCATVPPDAGFDDVAQRVESRLGQRVRWNRGTEQDAEAKAAIDGLLAKELAVDSAVQIALLNNGWLQAKYEDLGVSQAEVVQAGLLKNPVFSFSAGVPLAGGQVDMTISVAQDFLEVIFIPLRKAVAEAQFESAKLGVTAEVLDVAARTRMAFYRVQADDQLLEMYEQVVSATDAGYDAAERLHKAGNIRDLDLHNEKAMRDQSRLDLTMAQSATMTSRETLNRVLGLWGADTGWTIAHRLPPVPSDAIEMDNIEADAVRNSLDLAMVRQRIQANGYSLGLTKATALAPSLELGPDAEREDGDWDVGPHLSLPIPLFDQGQARIAAAQAELRRQRQLYIATAVDVRSAAREARQRLATARRVALFYQDEVLPLRQKIVNETMLEYNAMQVGVFQILNAKQQQIETGRRYVESLYAYWSSRTGVEALRQGRMSGADRSNTTTMSTSPMMSGAAVDRGGH